MFSGSIRRLGFAICLLLTGGIAACNLVADDSGTTNDTPGDGPENGAEQHDHRASAGHACNHETDAGRVLEAGPENYREKLDALKAGDCLMLQPGVYVHGLRLRDIHGEPDSRVIIEGPQSGRAVFEASSGSNTVSLRRVSYLTLRDFELDGQSTNASGIVLERQPGSQEPSHHVTLEGLIIRNYDQTQGLTGITTREAAWGWIIRGNRIEATGTGLYLGQPDGSAPFIDGLIEHNLVRDTLGYNMQIKHQAPWSDASIPGIPSAKAQTIIRHNVFSKAVGGNTGDRARPNVLLGHFPTEGPGADHHYAVYGNFFYQNPTDQSLLQSDSSLAVFSNLFYNTDGPAVRIREHNDVPRNVAFLGNTVVARDTALQLRDADPAHEQTIAGNLIFAGRAYAADPSPRTETELTDGLASAENYLSTPALSGEAIPELHPRDWDAVPNTPAWELPDWVTGALVDFDGHGRVGNRFGAYTHPPCWSLAEALKPPEALRCHE